LPDLAKANPFRTNIVRSTYRVLHDGGLMKFLQMHWQRGAR